MKARLALLLSTTLLGGTSAAQAATWEQIMHAGGQSADWLVYGGNLANTRYVDNAEVNSSNVGRLHLKWMFQTGVIGSFETTPIVEDGVMYVTSPYDHVFAIDARTGRQLWHYEQKLDRSYFCCGPNNRGVAIHGDKLFLATLDAGLVALNKKTGEVLWEQQVADPAMGYSETVAPTIYKDKVILGVSGAEYGIRGFISAYNVEDGKLAWRWHTIPAPDEVQPDGTKGWYGNFTNTADGVNPLHRDIQAEQDALQSGKYDDAWQRGGGSNWMTNAVDPERGMVFATVGNPSPDLYDAIRPGDNRWTESLVALDAETGQMKWGYQYVPHDPWDLDAVSPPILTEAKDKDGKTVPVVVTGGKTGWVYVHNRDTGELIRRSDAMIPQENLFARPTAEGTRMLPGANGGVEWSPGALNPKTRLVYYANLHQPMIYKFKTEDWQPATEASAYSAEQGRMWLGGAFTAVPGEAQWGNLSAVNIDTGKIAWQAKSEFPMMGGAVTTSGNLVFAGEADGSFNAYNAATGQKLWSFQCGAGANAAPMAFEVDGKQYVAIAAGGNFQISSKRGDSVLVFGLD